MWGKTQNIQALMWTFVISCSDVIHSVVQLGRLGLGWIAVAEISWLALSEDPRKQTDKFGVVVDIPRIHVLVGSLGRNST